MTGILHKFTFSLHLCAYYQRRRGDEEAEAQCATCLSLNNPHPVRNQCPKILLCVNTCAMKQHTSLALTQLPSSQVDNKYLLYGKAANTSTKWVLMEIITHGPVGDSVCHWSRLSNVPSFPGKLFGNCWVPAASVTSRAHSPQHLDAAETVRHRPERRSLGWSHSVCRNTAVFKSHQHTICLTNGRWAGGN